MRVPFSPEAMGRPFSKSAQSIQTFAKWQRPACLQRCNGVDNLAVMTQPWSPKAGAVLLEVVLALVLFVAAAAVLTSALSSSLDGVERLRLETHAADLAVSVVSELQLGIKTLTGDSAQPFVPPLEGWTWEAQTIPDRNGSDVTNQFTRVEVIIRHDQPALVYRLSEVLRLDGAGAGGAAQLPGVSGF
jgi:type II secretory pathway pseudopilin PulG